MESTQLARTAQRAEAICNHLHRAYRDLRFYPEDHPMAAETMAQLFDALSKGGSVMMPLDNYPFATKYSWVQDRFGISWQLMLA